MCSSIARGTSYHISRRIVHEHDLRLCVAVRQVQDTSPFGKGKLVKQFRVVYGVYRRSHSGNPVRDVSGNYTPFETIDGQDRFDPVLPEEPLEVATADALCEALDARRAAPQSSGAPAPAPAEHPKLADLRKEIANRSADPALLDGWTIDTDTPQGASSRRSASDTASSAYFVAE